MAICSKCGREFERNGKYRTCRYCISESSRIYHQRIRKGLPPVSKTCGFCGGRIEGNAHILSIYQRIDGADKQKCKPKRLCVKCTGLFLEKIWGVK